MEPQARRGVALEAVQAVAVRLDQSAEFLPGVETVEGVQDQIPSGLLQRRQVLFDDLLFKGEIAGPQVHNRRDIRFKKDVERVVPVPDNRFDCFLRHRRSRPGLIGRPDTQQETHIPDGLGGIESGQAAKRVLGERLQVGAGALRQQQAEFVAERRLKPGTGDGRLQAPKRIGDDVRRNQPARSRPGFAVVLNSLAQAPAEVRHYRVIERHTRE